MFVSLQMKLLPLIEKPYYFAMVFYLTMEQTKLLFGLQSSKIFQSLHFKDLDNLIVLILYFTFIFFTSASMMLLSIKLKLIHRISSLYYFPQTILIEIFDGCIF